MASKKQSHADDALRGDAWISGQHRTIDRMAAELRAILSARLTCQCHGCPGNQTAEQLATYLQIHFQNQESIMRLHEYPKLDQHKAEHDRFIAEVLTRAVQLCRRETYDSRAKCRSILQWLDHHAAGPDHELSEFLSHGNRREAARTAAARQTLVASG